jgi:2-(1,2-epoxy-1,2-dihydrophenyl)acetyl-CoA isomerase
MSGEPVGEPTILYSQSEGVATLRLNRPDRRNALTAAMLGELAAALAQAEDDRAVRAVVLTGEGKGFCAGQDLAALGTEASSGQVRTMIRDYYTPVILRLCTMPKPVIGAINGVAAGAGASLALACDLRVMADDASLLQAFVNIALVPDAGSTYFLTRLVGYSRALEIALSGARVPAARCLELGLANRVVPAAELPAAAQGWAAELAQGPTQAIGLTKQLLHQATLASLEEMLEREAELQTIAIQSADHREGVAAFREKRIPRFQGR